MTQDIVARKELAALLRREGKHSGAWFADRLIEAADLIDRLSCPAGDVEAVLDAMAAAILQANKDERLGRMNIFGAKLLARAALAASQPQASRDSVLEVDAMRERQEAAGLQALSTPPPPPISAEEERVRAGMTCEDEGCPHYGTPHAHAELCSDCPPRGHPTDETRCLPCPRRGDHNQPELPGDVGGEA